MLFFRFQGTDKIETSSCCFDLLQIYNDKHFIKDYKTLYEEHKDTLSLRVDISPKELLKKVIDCKSVNEVYPLIHNYKVDGVFAYNAEVIMRYHDCNDIASLIEYIKDNKQRYIGDISDENRMVQSDKYLMIFDGDLIVDFLYNGCLTRVNKVKDVVAMR